MEKIISIHKVNYSDCINLANLHKQAWIDAYSHYFDVDWLNQISIVGKKKQFKQDLANSRNSFFLVKRESVSIGFLILNINLKTDESEIVALYLLQKYWYLGYGKAVMDYAIAFSINAKMNMITLWVLNDNSQAISFYQKSGFSNIGIEMHHQFGDKQYKLRKMVLNLES